MKQRQHKLWRALLCPLLLLTLFLTGCGQAAVPASQPPAAGTAQQPSFSAPLSSAPLQASAESSEPAGPAEPSAAEPEVTPPPEGSEAAAAGSSPDEVPWNFDGKTGVLTFEGSGSLSSVEPETADNLSYGWTDLSSDVTSVVIGEGITRIPKFAFYGFQRLQSVSLPSTLTSIGTYAFFQCAFQEIALPDSVESIGAGAFSNCQQLRSCAIPEKVTVLEPSVFGECDALQTITFHEGLAELKGSCLWCCDGISSLVIPSSVTNLEELYAGGIKVMVFLGDPPALPQDPVTGEYWMGYGDLTVYYPEGNSAWQELAPHCAQNITWIEGIPSDGE